MTNLNKSDIESLGFKKSNLNNFDCYIKNDVVIVYHKNNKYSISDTKNNYSQLFLGTISNKLELIKLLKQTGTYEN